MIIEDLFEWKSKAQFYVGFKTSHELGNTRVTVSGMQDVEKSDNKMKLKEKGS